jgi:hypothetical protein
MRQPASKKIKYENHAAAGLRQRDPELPPRPVERLGHAGALEPPAGDMGRATPPIRNGESVSFIALNRSSVSEHNVVSFAELNDQLVWHVIEATDSLE